MNRYPSAVSRTRRRPFRRRHNASVVVRRAFAAAALQVLAVVSPAAAACSTPVGTTVSLKSFDIDPDVFVWDSRARVVSYAAQAWESTHEVLIHSMLAKPGTRAVVVHCEPGVVRVKFVAAPQDAVAVRLLTGPNRGRSGWVTSSDVHVEARTR